VIELFDTLRTCADIRTLGTRGIGEGPTMDFKERLSFTEQGTLTARTKKELARDVSALANAQGGLLVIGVKDPEREGEPLSAGDFVGVAVPETFARDLESSLLGSVSPPMYPFVRVTEDDFEHAAAVRPPLLFEQRLDDRPLLVGQVHARPVRRVERNRL